MTGPCIGDYPHIGLDANGFYVTTNEYSFLSNTQPYTAAQLYAISKVALAHGASSIQVVLVENLQIPEAGQPGFTVWPANVPANRFSTALGGTIFFASSMSTIDESHDNDGIADAITVWSLSNTSSLNTATPSLILQHNLVRTEVYGIPPFSAQKAGDIPLGDCLNLDCFGFGPPPTTQVEGSLNSNDSRMQQTWFAKGKLFAALDTIVNVGGEERAGIAWFVFFPRITGSGGLSVKLSLQGYIANENNNVTYPAVVADANGRGYIAFTLVGEDYYPSAAYTRITFNGGTESIHIAGAGVGPQDGFTEYFIGGGRPRWGDYGGGDHRRDPQRVDRLRVDRADLHARAVPGEHELRGNSQRARQLVDEGDEALTGLSSARQQRGPASLGGRPPPSIVARRRRRASRSMMSGGP